MENNRPNTAMNRQSLLPRPSRLPLPQSLRPSPSIDSLKVPNPAPQIPTPLSIPRLRATPSKSQLRQAPSISSLRKRDVSADTNTRVPAKPTSSFKSSAPRTASEKENQHVEHVVTTSRRTSDASASQESETSSQYELRPRKARLSLSERTVETLAHLPSSPAIRNRNASFYDLNSPMRPPSRGYGSRPGTSGMDSSIGPAGSTSRSVSRSSFNTADTIPIDVRIASNSSNPEQVNTPSKLPKTLSKMKSFSSLPRNPGVKLPAREDEKVDLRASRSPERDASVAVSTSKPTAARTLKPRASMIGLRKKPSIRDLRAIEEQKRPAWSGLDLPETGSVSFLTKESRVIITADITTPRKPTTSLRDTIAKAKAAKRAQVMNQASAVNGPIALGTEGGFASASFDSSAVDDPFNLKANVDANKGLLRKRVESARIDGRLNIAAMGLKEIPVEVMNMYNLDSMGSGSWAESVDLTRFVAADNDFEVLADDIFPDLDPQAFIDEEDSKGNQFGGLETLDLHGNSLVSIPMGLRRLELLTTLNLSNNSLDNSCFDILTQIRGLRDLKLANNKLDGVLCDGISTLSNLEIIDIRSNALTSIPESIADLTRLRVLNLSANQLTAVPFYSLQKLPLIQLDLFDNKISGVLMSSEDVEMPYLQILDVTSNQLKSLGPGNIHFPALHQLSCSGNRLSSLPVLTSWLSLLTLIANDNSIASIPEGFVDLPKLKNVDFSSNNIADLDDRIGLMESLDILRLGGNPLRERKFSAMQTENLKRALKGRLTPKAAEHAPEMSTSSEASFATATSSSPISSQSASPTPQDWIVRPGGLLDGSKTKKSSLNPVQISQLASLHTITSLQLSHNTFNEIPSSIAFFTHLTILSLAHNDLTSDSFLKDDLELPNLRELNLSSNTFSSLQPLIQRLHALKLEKIDISFNRLNTLSPLKKHFPSLTVVLASHNTIRELFPDAVRGLKILDCSSNEINSLNAKIGLLGGDGGLERLEVSGNRFRVPNHTILEKGTEALLTWLRSRIPVAEMEELGNGSDDRAVMEGYEM